MQNNNCSPRIEQVSWGRLKVEGRGEPYKDAKLFPGGSREWNWSGQERLTSPAFKWPMCRSCWITAPPSLCFRVEWLSAFRFRARRFFECRARFSKLAVLQRDQTALQRGRRRSRLPHYQKQQT